MELRQLEAFVAVATELHFGRAAEKLRIGQPTLSDLIRRLERELGAELLTRSTRKVAVTGAGQELLGRAKVILDEVAAASAAVRRTARGETGTVRVAITPPVAPVLIPHLNARRSRAPARRHRERAADVATQPHPGPRRGHRRRRDHLCSTARRTRGGEHRLLQRVPPGGIAAEPSPRRPRSRWPSAIWRRTDSGFPVTRCFPRWTLAQRQALDSAGCDTADSGS